MTLKNGFSKCSLFVLSANGWKDQNMDSSFSRQRKPLYGEGIARLTIRFAAWRQSEVSVDFQKVLRHDIFSPERSLDHNNQPKATRVCIRSINQSNRSISVRLLFLFCSAVFISRSCENRSINTFYPSFCLSVVLTNFSYFYFHCSFWLKPIAVKLANIY